MTYKGKEITEDQITIEMVRDIVLNQYFPTHPYSRTTWGYPDRDTTFSYAKILEVYKKYIHRHNSKPPADLESGIHKVIDMNEHNLITYEVRVYIEQKKKEWHERKLQQSRGTEKPLSKYQDTASTVKMQEQFDTGVVELPLTKTKQGYSEQLEDIRWTMFRTFVFVVRGQKCEQCGSTHYLNLHHVKYIPGRKAWEYNCNEVQVLCRECHEKVHNIQKSA